LLARSKDKVFLFDLCNHDDIYPQVSLGHPKPLDISFALEDDNNIFLANEHGGFLFIKYGPVQYDVHTLFMKSGRGAMVYEAAKEAARYMFKETDAMILSTMVPHENERARKLAESVGFVHFGEHEINEIPAAMFELTIKRWVQCQQH
jgi:hypothetical protein